MLQGVRMPNEHFLRFVTSHTIPGVAVQLGLDTEIQWARRGNYTGGGSNRVMQM